MKPVSAGRPRSIEIALSGLGAAIPARGGCAARSTAAGRRNRKRMVGIPYRGWVYRGDCSPSGTMVGAQNPIKATFEVAAQPGFALTPRFAAAITLSPCAVLLPRQAME